MTSEQGYYCDNKCIAMQRLFILCNNPTYAINAGLHFVEMCIFLELGYQI